MTHKNLLRVHKHNILHTEFIILHSLTIWNINLCFTSLMSSNNKTTAQLTKSLYAPFSELVRNSFFCKLIVVVTKMNGWKCKPKLNVHVEYINPCILLV